MNRKKDGKFAKGHKVNVGRKRVFTKEHKKNISLSHKGKSSPRKGATLSEVTKRKISESKKGVPNPLRAGKLSNLWRGGVSKYNLESRTSDRYKQWRKEVVERDNYTCQECGIVGGWNKELQKRIQLHAHHIKSFADNKKLRFDVNNGTTLCVNCHIKTENYGIIKKKNMSKRDKPLRILMCHTEETAVGFYRIAQPAVALNKLPNVEVKRLPFDPKSPNAQAYSSEFYAKLGEWADVMVFQRVDNPKSLALVLSMKDTFKIPVIVEVDDYIHGVKSDNLAYKDYQPGSPTRYYAERMMRAADGMTVSTPWLKELYQNYCQNIEVLPNCVDLDFITKFKQREYDGIRIGYAAASGHQRDLMIAKNALMAILQENKDVTLHIFGAKHKELPNHKQIKFHNWVTFDRYYRKLATIGLDIGIAPLEDTYYNRAKSNLRWLEYSSLKIPTIASPVAEFKNTIKHAKDGFLAKEPMDWYKYLNFLVKDKKLRKEVGNNAYTKVTKQYDINKRATDYARFFNDTAKTYKSRRDAEERASNANEGLDKKSETNKD